jgi:hypothetical protein
LVASVPSLLLGLGFYAVSLIGMFHPVRGSEADSNEWVKSPNLQLLEFAKIVFGVGAIAGAGLLASQLVSLEPWFPTEDQGTMIINTAGIGLIVTLSTWSLSRHFGRFNEALAAHRKLPVMEDVTDRPLGDHELEVEKGP